MNLHNCVCIHLYMHVCAPHVTSVDEAVEPQHEPVWIPLQLVENVIRCSREQKSPPCSFPRGH